jgi:hypothetical protein
MKDSGYIREKIPELCEQLNFVIPSADFARGIPLCLFLRSRWYSRKLCRHALRSEWRRSHRFRGTPTSGTRGYLALRAAPEQFLRSSGFTGRGKKGYFVIPSEARNPSGLKTKNQERFFAQNRRSE